MFDAYEATGENASQLPKLPASIGGDIDFIIGTKYLRYHPQPVFSLQTGLTTFKSPFIGIDGKQGVIGGPHPVISEVDKVHGKSTNMCQYAYLSNQYGSHDGEFKQSKKLLCLEDHPDENTPMSCHFLTAKKQKRFEEVECAGSEILYR